MLNSCSNQRKGRIHLNHMIDPFDFHSWFVLIELANCLNLVETNQRKYSVMMIIECGVTWPALATHEPG